MTQKDHRFGKRSLGFDFVDCQRDSANFKQVWFALAAMAVLLLFVLAAT